LGGASVVGVAASVLVVVSPGTVVTLEGEVVVLLSVVAVHAVNARANASKKQRRRVMSTDYRRPGALN
jgi:hypothetical protein